MADLPNPYLENPEELFTYEIDELNREVWVRSRGGDRADRALVASENFLGINREELRRDRYPFARQLMMIKAFVENGLDQTGTSLLEQEVSEKQKAEETYAGMARDLARRWNLPGAMKHIDDLLERLQELHQRTQETPLFNPVFQLGLDLSRLLESGDIDLDALEVLVEELECASLQSRAKRLQRLVSPVAPEANSKALSDRLAAVTDFSQYKAQWQTPALHAVFTAHPTFLLTPAQTDAVAKAASSPDPVGPQICGASSERPDITLQYEHARAANTRFEGRLSRSRCRAQPPRQSALCEGRPMGH